MIRTSLIALLAAFSVSSAFAATLNCEVSGFGDLQSVEVYPSKDKEGAYTVLETSPDGKVGEAQTIEADAVEKLAIPLSQWNGYTRTLNGERVSEGVYEFSVRTQDECSGFTNYATCKYVK